jgi:RNA polymerase sigma-70 factor (ECF subfamily)
MFLELAAMSDSELVSLAEKGSPEAFQVLVDRYGALVRSIAAKFLGHDSMALEDSYQETILKALTKLGDLDDKSKFKSWLCTIARNQALDAARKRTVMVSWEREGDDGDPIHWEIADLKANPAEAQAQAEVEAIMRDVLEEIPDMYRLPIAMRFEEGLDYSEIAVELRKPLGTVKSLIHRGKLLIKEKVTRRAWGIEGAHVLASL